MGLETPDQGEQSNRLKSQKSKRLGATTLLCDTACEKTSGLEFSAQSFSANRSATWPFRRRNLKLLGCGSQDDPLVRTGHKRRVWMLPESNIPGLLFTTGFNAMPGALSDGSGCRLSQKFPVCYSLPVSMQCLVQ